MAERSSAMVMVAVAALKLLSALQEVTAGEPSVRYVQSASLGNFLVAANTSLSDQDIYATLSVASSCECRWGCWSDTRCLAVAVVVVSTGGVQCRLASKGPVQSTLITNTQATYLFWHDSVTGTYTFREDNLLYLIPTSALDFPSAKTLCAKIPGHRLLMPKTVLRYQTALNMATETGQQLWVDLTRMIDNGPKIWGDQTPYLNTSTASVATCYDDTPSPAAFRIIGGALNDKEMTASFYGVCEANPLGVVW
nr:uncharacterized protein LOC123763101 [Procambarus clarkii]